MLALCGVLLLAGLLGGIKFLQIDRMIAQGKEFVPPPVTVTATTVAAKLFGRQIDLQPL